MAEWLMVSPCKVAHHATDHLRSISWRNRLVLVDNTGGYLDQQDCFFRTTSPSVAGSWNQGVHALMQHNADVLFLVSNSVLFSSGAREMLDRAADIALEHGGVEFAHFGWHLIGIARKTLIEVGQFDENFAPAYYEDNDWLYRHGLLHGTRWWESGTGWPYIMPEDIRARHLGDARTLRDGGVEIRFDLLRDYYVAKWGGEPKQERFVRGWNKYDTWWWPQAETRLASKAREHA